MKLNIETRKIYYDGSVIDLNLLSDVEFAILLLLIENSPSPVSRDSIKEHCWTGKVVSDGSINVAINSIRTIFSHEGIEDIITTVRGVGYCISQKIEPFSDSIFSSDLSNDVGPNSIEKTLGSHEASVKDDLKTQSSQNKLGSKIYSLTHKPHALVLIIANITVCIILIKVLLIYIEVIKL